MLRVALIADDLTRVSLENECQLLNITPLNAYMALKLWKPDLLLVESAWNGYRNSWKFKIAAYPDYPKRNNSCLAKVVGYARKLKIPSIFWNKEDGVHFNRFIDSAKLFDHILTVDQNSVPNYRSIVASNVSVNTLMFGVQPRFHNFTGFNFKHTRANFIGSYSHHIHEKRRSWQDMFFQASAESGLGLTVVDRNSDRRSANYRYPNFPGIEVLPAVPHPQTAQFYKDYLVSLNINTIEDSETMFSRRLIEILACGGIAVSNPAQAIDRHFKDYCHIVNNATEAKNLLGRLNQGASKEDLQRAQAGAHFVLQNHTWQHRLNEITQMLELRPHA